MDTATYWTFGQLTCAKESNTAHYSENTVRPRSCYWTAAVTPARLCPTAAMVREQYVSASDDSGVLEPIIQHIYTIGIYGWRKRCLYLFILLFLILLLLNCALTIWILRVMWFNADGMGYLQFREDGLRLEGDADFLFPFYAQEISSREDSALVLHSSENISLNAREASGAATGSVCVGWEQTRCFGRHFTVTSNHDEKLFYADENGAVAGKGKLRVTGSEGALFERSVRTPLIKAAVNADLRLESPTRSLSIDAPKGVNVKASAGDAHITANFDILLDSKGLVILDAETVRLSSLPAGKARTSGDSQGMFDIFEVCVCPSGKLFYSRAGVSSTCVERQDC